MICLVKKTCFMGGLIRYPGEHVDFKGSIAQKPEYLEVVKTASKRIKAD